jgi:hypothetical protein
MMGDARGASRGAGQWTVHTQWREQWGNNARTLLHASTLPYNTPSTPSLSCRYLREKTQTRTPQSKNNLTKLTIL